MSRGGVNLPDTCSNYYELLGLTPFEADVRLVEIKVRNLMREARKYQVGPYAEQAEKHLNLLSAARTCLVDEAQKRKYDEKLRQELGLPPVVIQATIPPELAGPPDAEQARSTSPIETAVPGNSATTLSETAAPNGSPALQDVFWEPEPLFPASSFPLELFPVAGRESDGSGGESFAPGGVTTAEGSRAAVVATAPLAVAQGGSLAWESAATMSGPAPLGLPGEPWAYPQLIGAQNWLEERVRKIRSRRYGLTAVVAAVVLVGGVIWLFSRGGESPAASKDEPDQASQRADELSTGDENSSAQRLPPAEFPPDSLSHSASSDNTSSVIPGDRTVTRKDFRSQPTKKKPTRIDPVTGLEVALNEVPGAPGAMGEGTRQDRPSRKRPAEMPAQSAGDEVPPRSKRPSPPENSVATSPPVSPSTGLSPPNSQPTPPLTGETKPAETKPTEIKVPETKPSEIKPNETKPNETKPADPSLKKPDGAAETPATTGSDALGEDEDLKLSQSQVLAKLKSLRLNTIKTQGQFGLRSHTESLKIIQYAQTTFKNDRRFMSLLDQEIKSQVKVFPFLRSALDQAE